MQFFEVLIELSGNILLFLLVFGMSATVDINALIAQLQNRQAILVGTFLQFVVLPALGFAVVKVLGMDETMGITMLVVTSSPGGSYSNWWCSMFNADLALSVTMTAISTLLSILALPINLIIYSKFSYNDDVISSLDWTSLFVALVIVITAILLGLLSSAKIHSHKFNMIANKLGNIAGISLVLFSASMSNTGGGDTKLWNRSWKFYLSAPMVILIGLTVSNVITTSLSMKKPERVTVSIECCYQNVGIATSVALTMFKGDELAEAMGIPLYYGIMEAVLLGIYCYIAWKQGWTKAPTDITLWQSLVMSYEVISIETEDLNSIEVTLSNDSKDLESISENGETVFAYFRFGDRLSERLKNQPKKEPSGVLVSGIEK